ncbi:hypothetical protein K3495_g2856 [Podosphaera aphanis]|nr:hypothetical protein K3495_g2856 [Podosphaera aphanis]
MFCFILTALSCLLSLANGSYASPAVRESQLKQQPQNASSEYDIIIVGGGPAGLSALSAFARVRRSALMIDSGEYRNDKTTYNHDIIGFDGVPPALFRFKAREQIARYPSAYFTNETVTSIVSDGKGKSFTTTVSGGRKYKSRKIVLATGIIDIIPETPGFQEAWARGMYWCPWCDSWEHRDQSLGIISPITNAIDGSLSILTLNKDVIAFVNGTDTPANRKLLDIKKPGWRQMIEKSGIKVENRTIIGIERLQNGSKVKNETNWEEFDLFRVSLEGGAQILRASFLADFPKQQRSYLGQNIGVKVWQERIKVDPLNMRAAPGVWGIGDANSDNTTNVPHAMYSGKKAAVSAHIELAREESSSSISKRSEMELLTNFGNDIEDIWNNLRKRRLDGR